MGTLLLMTGCFVIAPQNFKKKDQNYLFSRNYSPDHEGKLRIDGYYYIAGRYTSPWFLIFYPDGTFMYNELNGVEYFETNDGGDSIGLPIYDLTKLATVDKNCIGIYKVYSDTLIIESYQNYMQYELHKVTFHIEDSVTLRPCSCIKYTRNGVKSVNDDDTNYVYKFAPAIKRFSEFDNEMKEKKFLWENDSDRIDYIKKAQRYKSNLDL